MKKASRAVKAKKQEKVHIDKNRYLGLCSYCQSEPNCTFTRDPRRPVCECDEFSPFTYAPIRVPIQKKISLKSPAQHSPTREDPFRHDRGLCGDCEGRATCLYPKPEGGVWHCEEFRQGM